MSGAYRVASKISQCRSRQKSEAVDTSPVFTRWPMYPLKLYRKQICLENIREEMQHLAKRVTEILFEKLPVNDKKSEKCSQKT